MPMDQLITYITQWALIGLLVCFIIPKIEWKTQWKKRLFIFACGPFVWMVLLVVTTSVKFGIPMEFWRR